MNHEKGKVLDKKSAVELLENKLIKEFLDNLYEQFVIDGVIKTEGKTEKQLAKEFDKKLRTFADQDKFYNILIYTEDLLEKAQTFRRKKEYNDSCLYYATWYEHWMNDLLRHFLVTKGKLSHDNFKEMIRGTNIKVKFGCFPQILGLPAISITHKKIVIRIAELRNSYIHYKFSPEDVDFNEKTFWQKELISAQKTVKYLNRYKDKHIYMGLKGKLSRPNVKKKGKKQPH